jgi:hypothetical protein
MARWLLYDKKPFNTINSDHVTAIFDINHGRTFTLMSPNTDLRFLDGEFDLFTDGITKLLLMVEEELSGHCFVQIFMTCGLLQELPSFLVLVHHVDSNFKWHTIPVFLLLQNNKSHSGESNALLLKETYLECFQIVIDKVARYVMSDTLLQHKL